MTQWGMLLLCVYIALGVSRSTTRRQAGRIALVLTAVVIGVVMISYTTSGPSVPTPTLSDNIPTTTNGKPSTEDTAGRQQETPAFQRPSTTPSAGSASGGGS